MATYIKDPQAVLDYGFDWSLWLQAGETISTSTWTVGSGLTKGADSIVSGETIVWLSAGTAGSTYSATNHITTSQGRTDERTITISVQER